ncbi:NAD-dependent epimerase/dehydratase family protein [Fulvivirgaceae bacterium PWU5]|uniref:NAD-dependent epimerase/dehydratase family protein n=1 Tax=Dawidia cretensis TaxID=2782350 RepID=A0AAP2E2Q2_9BACT|nr:NAD-dependent epimerase/dehydratase family protein [Dawidia cretensis]MBT1711625.1 NAD-dependent epimerase/dehydratase family protein [Dawidia cretensis]
MKEQILITGASGFVGFHLIEAALAKGLEVTAAVRSSSKIDHLRALPVKFITPDFTSVTSLRTALEAGQYQYVIHAAGTVKAKDEPAYNAANADVTRNIAEAIAQAKLPVKKFVFLSSLAAQGPGATGEAIREEDAAHPISPYGKSKLLAEQYLRAIPGLPTVMLRPTAVYGPRDRDIFILLKTFAQGLEPYIGRMDQQLSFIYVKDLAAATLAALADGVTGTYLVADGNGYGRYALADITKRILNRKTVRVHLPLGVVKALAFVQETLGNIRGQAPALNRAKLAELTAANWTCNVARLQHELGFTPKYTLETGLAETIQWYKDNRWL